jgi:uncharacterized membrane protein
MTTPALRTLTLMAATLTMGLVTGVFALYAHTIMPGLKQTDDRTFVGSFQAIDRAIINPWFIGGSFLAALAFTAAATIVNRGERAFTWAAVALVAYAVVVVITGVVHVPLNNALKAAGDAASISKIAEVRVRFNEARWATFNVLRTLASCLAFASLTWALVVHGRTGR